MLVIILQQWVGCRERRGGSHGDGVAWWEEVKDGQQKEQSITSGPSTAMTNPVM